MNDIRYILIVIFLGISLISNGQNEISKKIKFKKLLHNFGAVNARNGDLNYEFSFINENEAPVKIEDVDASCGCTIAKWTRNEVKPHAEGTIKVLLKINKLSGYFSKVVKVYFGDKEEPKVLQLTGRVLKNYKYDDPFKIRSGHLYTDSKSLRYKQKPIRMNMINDVKFINMNKDTIKLNLLSSSNKFQTSVKHHIIPPGANSMITIKPLRDSVILDDDDILKIYTTNKSDTIYFEIPIIN